MHIRWRLRRLFNANICFVWCDNTTVRALVHDASVKTVGIKRCLFKGHRQRNSVHVNVK